MKFLAQLCLSGLCLGLLASVAGAQATRPDRIASWTLVGGATQNVKDRKVDRRNFNNGWQSYRRFVLQPQVDWGCRRIFLRNPFGTRTVADPTHDDIEFSQYEQALRETPWQTRDFVEQIRVLTSQNIEVVAYIGSPDIDPNIIALKDKPHELYEALWRNLAPYIQARCSIAFDASAPHNTNSLVFPLAQMLRRSGIRVYVEARPGLKDPHWFDYPIICEQNFWQRSDPAQYPDAAWAARNEQLTGEKVIIVVPADGDWRWVRTVGEGDQKEQVQLAGTWEADRARAVLGAGLTAALPMEQVLLVNQHLPQLRITRAALESPRR
jgi:hypothetical protein